MSFKLNEIQQKAVDSIESVLVIKAEWSKSVMGWKIHCNVI